MNSGLVSIQMLIVGVYIVLSWKNRQLLKPHYKIGLLLAATIFACKAPGIIYNLLKISEILGDRLTVQMKIGFALGFGFEFLLMGWYATIYAVGAHLWLKARPVCSYFDIKKTPQYLQPYLVPATIGVAAGILSVVILKATGVESQGKILNNLANPAVTPALFPGVILMILTLTAAAMAEEITFRGGIIAYLIWKFRNNTFGQAASVAVVSLAWALMHLSNTSSPGIKISQIFLIGILFFEIARRYGLKGSITAHVCFNIIAFLPEIVSVSNVIIT